MPTVNVNFFEGRPLLDLRSYGRRGTGRRDHLSPGEVAQISRTVRRVPEVMVKVLPRDSNNLSAVGRHIEYIGRKGELELETDDGDRLGGKGVGRKLLDDWDLDLDEYRRTAELGSALGRNPPKVVHKLMFSMPAGTSAEGVLTAARNFLREEFALKHRYAFVLHTDEPHPHVHAVVKAVSEQGVRLNIRKSTLRQWRSEFARHLRVLGVAANATERAVRGDSQKSKKDEIFRAGLREGSTFLRAQVESVAAGIMNGKFPTEPRRSELLQTRNEVERGWLETAALLARDGHHELASEVRQFADRLPEVRTDRDRVAQQLRQQLKIQRAQIDAVR